MSDSIFIYSTDTVWGIGGNIHEKDMALRINKIKGYNEVKPLSILFDNLDRLNDYFDLTLFDREWLKGLFKMEATLGLPIKMLKKDIPSEIYSGSDFVCVRVLDIEHVKDLIEMAGAPVFTTSFNQKGEDPILELDEAKKLRNELCPEAQVLGSSAKLSGHSSTIIVLGEDRGYSILRPGNRVKEIEAYIKLLTT